MDETGSEKPDSATAQLGHELGNLLAPIRNALRLMEHARADPRTIEYARGVIRQQLAELEKLTERLTGGEAPGPDIDASRRSRRILIADDNRAWVDTPAIRCMPHTAAARRWRWRRTSSLTSCCSTSKCRK
jgi:signal transduction histidine kinase